MSTKGLSVGKHEDTNIEQSISHWPGVTNRVTEIDEREDNE